MKSVLLPLLTESEVQLLEAGEEEDKTAEEAQKGGAHRFPTAEITGDTASRTELGGGPLIGSERGSQLGQLEVVGGGAADQQKNKKESVWGIHFLEIPKKELFPNPATILGRKAVLPKFSKADPKSKRKKRTEKKEVEVEPPKEISRVSDAETTKRMLARVLENRRLRRMGSKIALVKSESIKRMFCEDEPGYHPLKPAEKMENIEPITLPKEDDQQSQGVPCTSRVCRASAPIKKRVVGQMAALKPISSLESVTSTKAVMEDLEEGEDEVPEEEAEEPSSTNVFNRLYRLAMGPQQLEKRDQLRMRKEMAIASKPRPSAEARKPPLLPPPVARKTLPKITVKSSVQRFKTRGPRLRGKKNSQQESKNESLYPETMQPFSNPKEAVTRVILQLENPEWEVIMQGLQGTVRLSRHHPRLLHPPLHAVVLLLGRHIRNLRSQVARAATQASMHLFGALGRALDSEVDDLTGCLLSRMADTNKFLRGDSAAALSAMVDNASPHKTVAALVNRGAKHQNAVMRCATGRLLVQLCNRLGPERVMSLPKETRDGILVTGAKLLTEGSLETRRYAKELFTLLSADPRLMSIMNEVVPSNIMRSIGKIDTIFMQKEECKG